jgi:hypothetical protein
VGNPIISCAIGTSSYHGLCDIGASISVIQQSPDNLGKLPPPKEDPSFELKPLPDDLKYAYLDEKNIYPVIISANLSVEEEG